MTAVQDDLTEAPLGGPEDTSQVEPDLFARLHAGNQELIAKADNLLSRLDILGPKIEQRLAHERVQAREALKTPGGMFNQFIQLSGVDQETFLSAVLAARTGKAE